MTSIPAHVTYRWRESSLDRSYTVTFSPFCRSALATHSPPMPSKGDGNSCPLGAVVGTGQDRTERAATQSIARNVPAPITMTSLIGGCSATAAEASEGAANILDVVDLE